MPRALLSVSDKTGIVELGRGLASRGFELVSTGGTLKANKLVAVEDIMEISSRLVVNQASLKVKRETLQPIIDAFARAVER